jgi:hypothetical protein
MGIATAIVGSALIGGAVASRGASKQARAIREGAAEQKDATLTAQREALAATQPFRDISLEQMNQLAALYAPGGEYYKMPSYDELQFDPAFALREEAGMRALERSAAARGGLLSGSMLRGVTEYGQRLKSEEYQNAMARAMGQRAARTNVLSSIAGLGPAIAGQQANIITGSGTQLANIAGQAAQGRASAYGAKYNALGQAIGQAGMGYGLYKGGYFDRVGGGQG